MKFPLAVVCSCAVLTGNALANKSFFEINAKETNTMNRLSQESSPYLLQHKSNPVAWYSWGEEAFEAARRDNKPIFLSVGYSTCHWCHVMNRESFSDPVTAAVMNKHFINVKLDREERPDVDRVYMAFVQATTGGGGWPMSVWLTPELDPIVGGTYFPPEDRYGRPGFKTILERIAVAWANDEQSLRKQATEITGRLREYSNQDAGLLATLPDASLLDQALQQMSERFDEKEGGFGSAPKFPRPSEIFFLLNEATRRGTEAQDGQNALMMASFTLEKMARGGIHDHLGGGFHRYSVDARWHIPHYEKMLYDQAQLVEVYLAAYQLSRRKEFARTVQGILAYVRRDMTSPEGAFYSAEDADSLPSSASTQKSEGAFYIWTKSEIDALLGDDSPLFCTVYGVEPAGNALPESDPHGELAGTNTLVRRLSDSQAAEQSGLSPADVAANLASARQKLLAARSTRPRPHLDDKVITAWNGLMITALAKTYQTLGDKDAKNAAQRAARFLHDKLYDADEKTLRRIWREDIARINAFAEDYAYLIRGLIDLYEADFDPHWLAWALDLQSTQDQLFWDKESGGYFSSTGQDPSVLLRMKETYDGAEPSPSSISALNLLRLSHLLADPDLSKRANQTLAALTPQIRQSPLAAPLALVALASSTAPSRQVVLVGDLTNPTMQEMLATIRSQFRPDSTIVVIHDEVSRNFFSSRADFYKSLSALDGQPTAYLCQNFVCELPTTDPEVFKKLLAGEIPTR